MTLRSWATPLTVGAFLIMAVTGTLMFFHVDGGLNKLLHEWAGWAMVAAVVAHLLLNWRAFTTYFRKPLAKGIMALGVLALALSFVPMSGSGGSPVPAVMAGIGKADVDLVIALSGQDLESGLIALNAAGFEATAGQSMRALTGGDRGKQAQIIAALFTP